MSTTTKERYEVMTRLGNLGIAYADACALRRISLTLRRWFELECGDGHGHIERDEETGRPRYHRDNHSYIDPHDPRAWSCIADRETGAQVRLSKIMARYPHLTPYIQTDPRGASLYLLTERQRVPGQPIENHYSNGTAIY
jgi:hypothetical protein